MLSDVYYQPNIYYNQNDIERIERMAIKYLAVMIENISTNTTIRTTPLAILSGVQQYHDGCH
jgi:hypothetical protein